MLRLRSAGRTPGSAARPASRPARPTRAIRPASPVAALKDRGTALDVSSFDVNRGLKSLGEGSYGQVYETVMDTPSGPTRVVLKRMKPRVSGAASFFESEHLLNVYAARKARDGVASFYGYVEVPPEAAGRQLGAGTYLCWLFEGGRTLADFLRRRDCEAELADALGFGGGDGGCPLEPGVLAATVVSDILAGLVGLHAAGVVHRDVKPANLILAEVPPGGWGDRGHRQRAPVRPLPPRFKLIDLGAAADLRTGTNYEPVESVLDPLYCPPEKFVLPTDGPDLASKPGVLASSVLSPLLWSRWRPDAFDSYSVGLVLMQVALPRLRSPAGLRSFNTALARAGGDLEAWRAGARLSRSETGALDALDGAGWDLAAALLAPRPGLETTPDGGVSFEGGVSGGGGRPTAAAALKHPFIARLAVPVKRRMPASPPPEAAAAGAATPARRGTTSGSSASGGGGRVSSAVGLLTGTASALVRSVSKRLFALEGRLLAQAEAVATQTTRVQAAAAAAAAKKGDAATAAALAAEERALKAEQAKLAGLSADFQATAARASETLSGLLGKGGGGTVDEAGVDPAARARAALAVDQGKAAPAPPGEVDETPPRASALTAAAVGGLAGALRWTGTALRVATALAGQVAAGAERAAAEEAERAAALRVDRADGLAFVEALRSLDPPPAPGDDWEDDVRPRLARDKRVTAVAPAAAAALYEAYAAALARAAAARAAEAERGFAAALAAAAIPHTVPWADAASALASHPATAAVIASGLDPAALYAAAQAVAADEAAFNDLLAETIGRTRRGARWGALRPSICDDPRFQPIPETRRREIYAIVRAAHDAAEAAAEAAEAEAAAARAAEAMAAAEEEAEAAAAAAAAAAASSDDDDDDESSSSSSSTTPPSPANGATAEALAAAAAADVGSALLEEQARLRAEYERMEAKLRAMEAALAAAAGGVAGSPVPGAVDGGEGVVAALAGGEVDEDE